MKMCSWCRYSIINYLANETIADNGHLRVTGDGNEKQKKIRKVMKVIEASRKQWKQISNVLNSIQIICCIGKRGICSYMPTAIQYIDLDIEHLNIKIYIFPAIVCLSSCVFYYRHFIGLLLLVHLVCCPEIGFIHRESHTDTQSRQF